MGALIIVIIIIVIVYSITNNNNRPKGGSSRKITKSNNYQDINIQKIASIDRSISIADFKSKVFTIYKDIQTAWMNFDTETIRKFVL